MALVYDMPHMQLFFTKPLSDEVMIRCGADPFFQPHTLHTMSCVYRLFTFTHL